MNAVALLFTLGYAVCLVGFAKAQFLAYRFVTCYYQQKGGDCDLLKIHRQGALSELAMLSGYILSLSMGIVQRLVTGSWLYLTLCLLAFIFALTTSYVLGIYERRLADQVETFKEQ